MKNPLTIHNLLLVDSKIEGYNLNLSDLGTDTFGAKYVWRRLRNKISVKWFSINRIVDLNIT